MFTDLDTSFIVEAFDAAPHAHALAGVLFAEEFDLSAAAAPAAPVAEAPAAVVTDADLLQSREQGYRDGRRAALEEHEAGTRAANDAARAALSRALEGAERTAREAARSHADATAATMLQLLAAALPDLCARHGAAEAACLAQALMPLLAHETRVVVRANPHSLHALRDVLSPHLAGPEGRVRVIGTDALAEGDITIEWQDGSARRDTRALCRALRDMLDPLGMTLDDEPRGNARTVKELAHAG